MRYILPLFLVFVQLVFAKDSYYYRGGKKVMLMPQNSLSRSYSDVDYYLTSKGISLGVTDKMLVKFKNSSTLNSYLNELNLTLVKKLSKNLYMLRSDNKDLTLDIANSLSRKSDILYAQPDFIKKIMKR